tara:strand:- start:1493 stop:2539 length:1047 start_codon:yes stop_codon:yes gene_type:complete
MSLYQLSIFDKVCHEARQNQENGMITLFLIGCFPNPGGNKQHEMPPIIEDIIHLDIPYLLVLIDPEYSNGYIPSYLQGHEPVDGMYSIGKRKVIIYPSILEDHEYSQIVELSRIVSKLNCLSYIVDFSGKERDTNANNDAIYIAPSSCLADVTTYGYRPPIIRKDNHLTFLNPQEIFEIYRVYNGLLEQKMALNNVISQELIKKIAFVRWCIVRKINIYMRSYVKMLTFIDMNDVMKSRIKQQNIRPIYKKDLDITQECIQHIKYRCGTYDVLYVEQAIDEWMKSGFIDLKEYITTKLQNEICYIVKIIGISIEPFQEDGNNVMIKDYLPNEDNSYENIFDKLIELLV